MSNGSRTVSQEAHQRAVSTIEDESEESLYGSSEFGSQADDDGNAFRARRSKIEPLAARETQAVAYLRVLVVLVLLLAMVLVSVAIYFLIQREENRNFERAFESQSQQILDAFASNVNLKLGAMESLAVSIASYAQTRKADWPLGRAKGSQRYLFAITVPDFAARAKTTRSLGRALFVGLTPVVSVKDRPDWEAYSRLNGQWISEGIEYEAISDDLYTRHRQLQSDMDIPGNIVEAQLNLPDYSSGFAGNIFRIHTFEHPQEGPTALPQKEWEDGPYLPGWQHSRVVPEAVNFNMISYSDIGDSLRAVLDSERAVISRTTDLGLSNEGNPLAAALLRTWSQDAGVNAGDPYSIINFPVFDTFSTKENRRLVAVLIVVMYWTSFLDNVLGESGQGIYVVVENGCDQQFSYQVNGRNATYLGKGDLHNGFDNLERSLTVETIGRDGVSLNTAFCPYRIRVWPSNTTKSQYTSNDPVIYMVVAICIFLFAIAIFITYDCIVERRQRIVFQSAVENSAVVASLFPSAIRARLFNTKTKKTKKSSLMEGVGGNTARNPLRDGSMSVHGSSDAVVNDEEVVKDIIADSYPETTVFFADIAGFTRWSSTREPAQVFELLQTLYRAFDRVAKKLGVFKIETIGDCYVAVTGLPDPQPDHCLIMARFARECLFRTSELVHRLTEKLGEDTANLTLRVGFHSGVVTAGVLQGEKSRFQLFGDTVNTASRMESNGVPNRIQCSEASAVLLRESGKASWLIQREEKVFAKGKGEMTTYWVKKRPNAQSSNHVESVSGSMTTSKMEVDTGSIVSSVAKSSRSFADSSDNLENSVPDFEPSLPLPSPLLPSNASTAEKEEHEQDLVQWSVRLLSDLLRRILASRIDCGTSSMVAKKDRPTWVGTGSLSVDEVVEIVEFHAHPGSSSTLVVDPSDVELSEHVVEQLEDFCSKIASMYRSNPFHNFDHACHVATSCNDFMFQIASRRKESMGSRGFVQKMCRDALCHFSVVLSAIVHDVDHTGVSNADLIRNRDEMADLYENRSIAEQNSLDIAWELLMDSSYQDLRSCIYRTQAEMMRFRQLMVNCVLATDIFDESFKDFRERRWKTAFSIGSVRNLDASPRLSRDEFQNLQATVVMELVLQASDVIHAMEEYSVFEQWNGLLFEEMMNAHQKGLSSNEPSGSWYEDEIMFFDFYIIPLAQKLIECGAFCGAAVCVNHALENRATWAAKGSSRVVDMIAICHRRNLGSLSGMLDSHSTTRGSTDNASAISKSSRAA